MPRMRAVDARTAGVVLLLAVGAVGARSWRAVPAGGAALRVPAAPVLVAFGVLEGVAVAGVVALLVMVWRRPRRRRCDEWRLVVEPVFGRWAKPVALLFGLLVMVLPPVLFVAGMRGFSGHGRAGRGTPPPPAVPGTPVTGTPSRPPAGARSVAGWPLGLVLAALVVAGIVLVLFLLRRRRARAADGPPPEDSGPLVTVVAAGERALGVASGPREAVIACYTAMEHALARSGLAVGDADTPAEVLARAAGAGLDRSGGAGALTRLFWEARYSVHPIGEEHRRSARSALADLRRELEARP